MTTETWDKSFQLLKKMKFPLPGYKYLPREKMIKQHICHLEFDRTKYAHEPMCLHVVFKQQGGRWNGGYIFEGASVEFSRFACIPEIDY